MIAQTYLFAPPSDLPLRQRVSIRPVEAKDVSHALKTWHYLKRVRTGRQLHYAVFLDGITEGVVTYAYPMTSSPIDGVPSDELLEFARLYLVNNIPHCATCVIGQTLKRIRQDWKERFPDAKPVKLVVSWSDTEYHKGTIYKAANFTWLRRKKGAPPGNKAGTRRIPADGTRHEDYSHVKDCWVYRWAK